MKELKKRILSIVTASVMALSCFGAFADKGLPGLIAPASAVTYSLVSALNPSCTSPGYKEHYKGDDGKLYIKNGDTYTEVLPGEVMIPALGHYAELIKAVEPTCTQDGVKQHYKCYRCNGLFLDQIGSRSVAESSLIIPAYHKKLTYVPAKKSTCTDSGYYAHYICPHCKKLFLDAKGNRPANEDSVRMASHGHKYYNGKCKYCKATDPVYLKWKDSLKIKDTGKGSVSLKWDTLGGVNDFNVYIMHDGRYALLTGLTAASTEIFEGSDGYIYVKSGDIFRVYQYNAAWRSFTKVKNVKPATAEKAKADGSKKYSVKVSYILSGRESADNESCKGSASVKYSAPYKPTVTAAYKKNKVTLKFDNCSGADNYRVKIEANGKTVTKLVDPAKAVLEEKDLAKLGITKKNKKYKLSVTITAYKGATKLKRADNISVSFRTE